MKSTVIFLLLCSWMIPYQQCMGQSKLQIDLDQIVQISEANLLNEVKFLTNGKFIDLTYWEDGCGTRGPLRRNLRIAKNASFYIISFCDLKKNMTNEELWPIIEEFSKSFLIMDPTLGCTTTKKLAIQNHSAIYLGIDSSCKWMGFTTLTMSIFNVLPHGQIDQTCLNDW